MGWPGICGPVIVWPICGIGGRIGCPGVCVPVMGGRPIGGIGGIGGRMG